MFGRDRVSGEGRANGPFTDSPTKIMSTRTFVFSTRYPTIGHIIIKDKKIHIYNRLLDDSVLVRALGLCWLLVSSPTRILLLPAVSVRGTRATRARMGQEPSCSEAACAVTALVWQCTCVACAAAPAGRRGARLLLGKHPSQHEASTPQPLLRERARPRVRRRRGTAAGEIATEALGSVAGRISGGRSR